MPTLIIVATSEPHFMIGYRICNKGTLYQHVVHSEIVDAGGQEALHRIGRRLDNRLASMLNDVFNKTGTPVRSSNSLSIR